MKMELFKQNKVTLVLMAFSLAVILILASTITLAGFGNTNPYNAVPESGVNENGQTYGPAEDLYLDNGPDLVAVITTDETQGYVYKTELLWAIDPYHPETPEEAERIMSNRFTEAALAFSQLVKAQTGKNASAEVEEIAQTLAKLFEDNGGEAPWEYLSDSDKSLINSLVGNTEANGEVAQAALVDAYRANDRAIRAYKTDGKTPVGEFIVQ